MSLRTNNPTTDNVPQGAGPVLSRRSGVPPAFKPQVLRSVRMRPVLAGLVAAAVFAALVGYAVLQKPQYSAESLVYLEPVTPKLVNDGTPQVFDSTKYEAFLGEQTQMMQRADVLTAAINALPQSTWSDLGSTPQAAVTALQGQLKVGRVMAGYQVSIGLKGPDPAKTADIVNAVAAAYLEVVHKANAAESDVRAQLLAEERQRVQDELKTARMEQTALGSSIGVANPTGEGGNPYDSELSGMRAQLMEARAAHDVAAAQLASISGVGPARTSGLAVAADDLMSGDPGLSTTKSNIAARKATLTAQMAGLTAANPIYKQDQDEIADLDRSLSEATTEARGRAERRLQDKLKTDLDKTGDIESRLNGELQRQIMAATSAAPKLQRASEVAADIQRLDIRLAAVDDTLRQLRMQQTGPGQVRISLAASAASSPEPNRKKLLLLAALPLALLLGAIAAVLARKQDKRIYGTIDLEDVLGFPALAVLPARSDVAERVFEEYVLRLAAGVEGAYRTGGARTFLLSAVSLTTDIRPLVTSLNRKFEVIGVNVMVATASDMLAPNGGAAVASEQGLARTAELWGEGFVAANMDRMKTDHALVLIEAEPLLNCGQTEYMARSADATILIVECGVTTREELLRAAELLERLNVTGIGAVLEELHLRFADATFREGISALERRRADSPYEQPRPMAPRVVQQAVQRPMRPVMQEPVRVAEVEQPRVEELVQAAPAEALEQAQVIEPVVERIVEPVMAAQAAVVEPVWQAPLIEPVAEPVVHEKLAAAAIAAAGPMLVEPEAAEEDAYEENLQEEPLIALANGTSHEKMASAHLGRRRVAEPAGDATMSRKASWLDRLLRRDAGSSFRIVPDDDDEVETEVGSDPTPVADKSITTSPEEYDLPLVSRLEQISRIRPAVQGTAYNSGTRGSRLQIVPQEAPAELVVPQAFEALPEHVAAALPEAAETHADAMTHEVEETFAAEASPALQKPVEWWREPSSVRPGVVEVAPVEPLPAASIAETPVVKAVQADETAPVVTAEVVPVAEAPVAEAPVAGPVARPRRPFSFHELTGLVPLAVPAVVESHAPVAPVEEVHELAAPEPVFAVQPVEIAQHVEVPVSYEDVVEPVVEAQHDVEPVPEASAPEVQPVWHEPAPEPVAVEPVHAVAEVEPELEPEQFEVEPVLQEASRQLTGGRWDPIPTLRPMDSWRERTVQENGNGAPQRWPRQEEVAANGFRQWTPQPQPLATPAPAAEAEPLSRQWGLLSKFQQARISGERSAAKPVENEPLREPSTPGGQRQS